MWDWVTGRLAPGLSEAESWIRPTRKASGRKQRVKLPGPLERIKFVTATDVRFANENLRHSVAAIGARKHFLTTLRLARNVNFRE